MRAIGLQPVALPWSFIGSRMLPSMCPTRRGALSNLQPTLGPDHELVGQGLNHLAALYESEGRYAEAEPLHKRTPAILEKALGFDHLDVGTSLNNLAGLHHSQGRYAEAERLYNRSLAIREKALGPNHTDVGASLNNLASLYHLQGRYADAEPLYERAEAIPDWEVVNIPILFATNGHGDHAPAIGQVTNDPAAEEDLGPARKLPVKT